MGGDLSHRSDSVFLGSKFIRCMSCRAGRTCFDDEQYKANLCPTKGRPKLSHGQTEISNYLLFADNLSAAFTVRSFLPTGSSALRELLRYRLSLMAAGEHCTEIPPI